MSIKSLKSAAAVLLFAATGVNAADLMVTPMEANGRTLISFEFVNDAAGATALEFDLKIAGVKMEQSQINGCTAGIYTKHVGSCAVNKDTLTVIVFSPENALLPTFELGSIVLDVKPSQISEITASSLVMANAKGNQISGGSILIDNSHLRNSLSEEQLKRFSTR